MNGCVGSLHVCNSMLGTLAVAKCGNVSPRMSASNLAPKCSAHSECPDIHSFAFNIGIGFW